MRGDNTPHVDHKTCPTSKDPPVFPQIPRTQLNSSVSGGQRGKKRALDPCSAVWAVYNPYRRRYQNPVISIYSSKYQGYFQGGPLTRPTPFLPPLWAVPGDLAFMRFNNLRKKCRGRKGVLVATPRNLRLLLFYRGLYFLCSTMCVMPFFTSLLYGLFLFNEQQSPGESNQEIISTSKQIKLSSRRA